MKITIKQIEVTTEHFDFINFQTNEVLDEEIMEKEDFFVVSCGLYSYYAFQLTNLETRYEALQTIGNIRFYNGDIKAIVKKNDNKKYDIWLR